jgi:CubicO group peptidase (beta-lactamase class C family)
MTSIESKETPRTHEEMLTIIAQKRPKYQPGRKSSYSNFNYLLLGYIIEKICNKSFADVLQERISSRIGLNNTYYGNKTNIEKNECPPYKFIQKWEQQSETDLSIPGASGALLSTPIEMLVFINALFAGKLISSNSLDQMKTVTKGYGMGFLEFNYNQKKALGYTGGIDEFESVLAYFPGDSLGIAYCSNGQKYPVKSIVLGALNIIFIKPYCIPDFKPATLQTKHLKKYIGVYRSAEIMASIKITKEKKTLFAQAKGYSPYLLEAIDSNKFKNDEVSVILEFNLKKNEMKLMQGNLNYKFVKEN